MSFLNVNNITVNYGTNKVIDDISFEINKNEITGILGINGCGKTTLLKAICNIIPHKGSCSLDNVVLEKLSTKQLSNQISYIPQVSGIDIDISVLNVVLMGFNNQMSLLQNPNNKMIDAAINALETVGLKSEMNNNYLHLSQGQKQLCIFARSLVSNSKLLLLDEPESALDYQFRYNIFSMLSSYVKNNDSAILVTLHDINLALNYCDKLLLVSKGKILTSIYPKKDSIEAMEKYLHEIYGPISLQYCQKRNGEKQLVLLSED